MELCLMAIAWLLGTLSGLYCKISIALFVLGCVLFCGIRRNNRYLKLICAKRYMVIVILSYLISYVQIVGLEKSFEEKQKMFPEKAQIIGTIISNPIEKEYDTNYTLKIDTINGKEEKQTVLLKVKKEKNQKKYFYGNQICFRGEAKQLEEARNEGGFNYKQYLKTKQIYGMVIAETNSINVINKNKGNILLKLANNVRYAIVEKANKLLKEKEASLLTALLTGNKETLDEEIEEAFRTSNLSHILAISGTHVSYIILGIGVVISKINISKKSGKIITMVLLFFFILMTGQTPSVTRACTMSIYLITARLFHKRVSVLSSISISFIVILILNPYSIFDIGLQLSFGGTIGILIFANQWNQKWNNKGKSKIIKKIIEMIGLTLSANVILIPITLYHFHTFSLTFLISNVLASPIMGILVILGYATMIVAFIFNPMGQLIAYPLQILLHLFLQIVTFTSKLPFSKQYSKSPNLMLIILYYAILLGGILYQSKRKKQNKRRWERKLVKQAKKITRKKIITIFLIFIVGTGVYRQVPKELRIHFIDVGQGDSTLIITPKGKNILIDGGGERDNDAFDVGKNIMLPYLLKKGITKLDYIFISHFDSDHVRFYPIFITRDRRKKCHNRKTI